jgi:hypothetical protein
MQNYFERDDVNKGKRAVKHLQGSGNVHYLCFFSSNEVSSLQEAQSVSGELNDLVELMYPQS